MRSSLTVRHMRRFVGSSSRRVRNVSSKTESAEKNKTEHLFWFERYFTRKNALAAGAVGAVGGASAFAYRWTTDESFVAAVEKSQVYGSVIGPVVPPSIFSVDHLDLDPDVERRAGEVFLALDYESDRGLTKIELVHLLDREAGYDFEREDAKEVVADLFLGRAVAVSRVRAYEEKQGGNVLRKKLNLETNVADPERGGIERVQDMPLHVLRLYQDHKDASDAIIALRTKRDASLEDAAASWWLFGFGKRTELLEEAARLDALIKDAEVRLESNDALLKAEEIKVAHRHREVASLDEFLVVLDELARAQDVEGAESTAHRMDRLQSRLKSASSEASVAGAAVPAQHNVDPFRDVRPVPLPAGASEMDEVNLSDRDVIEHELEMIRQKRKRLLDSELKGKSEAEWSTAQSKSMRKLRALEAELLEELESL